MRGALIVCLLASACLGRHGSYRPIVPPAAERPCSAPSSEGWQLDIERLEGDLRPGGEITAHGRLWNCGTATRTLSKWPGARAATWCLRPHSGMEQGPAGRIRSCTHGPCPDAPADVLTLAPGTSAAVSGSIGIIAPCHTSIELELRYESEREMHVDGLVYPPDLTTGMIATSKVVLERVRGAATLRKPYQVRAGSGQSF